MGGVVLQIEGLCIRHERQAHDTAITERPIVAEHVTANEDDALRYSA